MDLNLFFRVVSRFRFLVIGGFVAAVLLAFLSFVKVDFPGGKPQISYRSNEVWQSSARLLVTEPGFGLGNSDPGPAAADVEARLPNLAAIYSTFITSDAVTRIMLRSGPIRGKVIAAPLLGSDGRTVLPVVNITALDRTPGAAIKLGARAAAALRIYVKDQQVANHVDPGLRVELDPMNVALDPTLEQPRSKMMPIVIFLVVMFATLSLAL